MRRYFDTVKTLLKIASKKNWIVIQMFISSAINNVISLLPPVATSGIIAMITINDFNGIWIYVFLYILFYILYLTRSKHT